MVRGWYDRTPRDFRFALKVPQVITHQKQLRDCAEEVDGFVSSIQPLGDKLCCALLQMGYFNRGAFASLDEFLPRPRRLPRRLAARPGPAGRRDPQPALGRSESWPRSSASTTPR